MRKVVLQLAVSLKGYIEGPNGEYDWCFVDQDYGMSDFFKRIDAVFMRRKLYELPRWLVDEIILAVHPIILGKGMPLFSEVRDRIRLMFVEHKVYGTGSVMLTYKI